MNQQVSISVIVPTAGRERLLSTCVAAALEQIEQAPDAELIVVDNGAAPLARPILPADADVTRLRVVREPRPGLHHARHAGLRASRGEILAYLDDDAVVCAGWLATLRAVFADRAVVLAGGNNQPSFESEPPAWLRLWWETGSRKERAIAHLSILDLGAGEFDIDPHWVWGCNFAIRRGVLEAAGGFHPDGFPPEQSRLRGDGETAVSEWIRRRSLRARFHSGASVDHRVSNERMTPEYFVRRSHAQGVSDSFTDARARRGRPSHVAFVRRRMRAWLRDQSLSWRCRGEGAPDLRGVLARCREAYLAGYAWHRAAVRSDPALREWVCREDYMQ